MTVRSLLTEYFPEIANFSDEKVEEISERFELALKKERKNHGLAFVADMGDELGPVMTKAEFLADIDKRLAYIEQHPETLMTEEEFYRKAKLLCN
jgi:hypothetical protein